MALQSRLFRGDPNLEAAAVNDSAHIVQGATGDHVRKIQQALIQLDGAAIVADGNYGPATARAVLAYKQKRNIINFSYQTQADDIVGKMTMAALDAEMVAAEGSDDTGRIHCRRFPFDQPKPGSRGPLIAFALSGSAVGGGPSPPPPPPPATPVGQALAHMRDAANWVAAASRFLTLRKAQILTGLGDDKFKDTEERKACDIHFKLNQARKPLDHLNLLAGVYGIISATISRASSIFIDDPTTTDFANAFPGGFNHQGDPTQGKIRVGPNYAGNGPLFQTAVIVHEAAHFANVVIRHFASELPPPNGTPVDSAKNYAQLSVFEAAGNAYTYAQFALHAFMGFDKRLFPDPFSQ
jgi:hypothetical protein